MDAQVEILKSHHPSAAGRPLVCFIPGGPGLSSKTLSSMRILSRSFDLVFIDPPGIADLSISPTLSSIVEGIGKALVSLNRPLILCGHSFGGIYVGEIAITGVLPLAGLVFLASPLRLETLAVADSQYSKNMNQLLESTTADWEKSPSTPTFREWLGSYGSLFFSEKNIARGKQLINEDKLSYRTFLSVRSSWQPKSDFLNKLRKLSIPKMMIAGQKDQLLPEPSLRTDAELTGCKFFLIGEAAHFLTFDQPETVARLIEETFADGDREKHETST